MSGVVFQVPPLSRAEIRAVTQTVREVESRERGGSDEPFFRICEFLDVTVPRSIPEFVLEVCSRREMSDAHGMTYPDEDLIQVREDVYERACRGMGRDRLTLAHELGHYLLHGNIGLARRMAKAESIPAYRSSEWQASALAGELLIPARHIHLCRSPKEAALMFGVSEEAAAYQWRVYEREGLVRKR